MERFLGTIVAFIFLSQSLLAGTWPDSCVCFVDEFKYSASSVRDTELPAELPMNIREDFDAVLSLGKFCTVVDRRYIARDSAIWRIEKVLVKDAGGRTIRAANTRVIGVVAATSSDFRVSITFIHENSERKTWDVLIPRENIGIRKRYLQELVNAIFRDVKADDRKEYYDKLSTILNRYVDDTRNVIGAQRRLMELDFDKGTAKYYDTLVGTYNTTRGEFEKERQVLVSDIAYLWRTPKIDNDLKDIIRIALERVHKGIISMDSQYGAQINRAIARELSSKEKDFLKKAVTLEIEMIETAVNELDERKRPFLDMIGVVQ